MDLFKGKKFNVSQSGAIFSAILTFVLGVVYVIFLLLISGYNPAVPVPYYLFVFRDVSLVLFTIFLTAAITGWLIETKEKNKLYENTVLQDVLGNPTFYENFSDETKEVMLKTLEKERVFFGYKPLEDMYGSIKDKLARSKQDGYYFSRCEYDVVCSIQNNIITKEIKRTISLRSFEPEYVISNLQVLNWAGMNIPNCLTIHGVTDHQQKPFACIGNGFSEPRELDSFCGYSYQFKVRLRDPLRLTSSEDTTLVISYSTRVPLSDSIYTCRSSVPCKSFSVLVHLEDSPDYKLSAAAFGFLDSAPYARVNARENYIRVTFDDWVFTKDGVVIVFSPKT